MQKDKRNANTSLNIQIEFLHVWKVKREMHNNAVEEINTV